MLTIMSPQKHASKQQNPDTNTPHFLTIANHILPYLTPQELSSLSCTSTTLNHLSKSITTLRSNDASQSHHPHPIPFINTVDSHPYAFFLYTPTHLISPSSLPRQPWPHLSHPPSPNFNPPPVVSDPGGCCCGGECHSTGCPCFSLRSGEMGFECGPGCRCGPQCGNRVSQQGVLVRLKIVRCFNKGWGLFADQFIASGEFICEYAGELLTTKEARKRQQAYDELARSGRFFSALLVVREHLPSRKACFRINIDATRIGNVARFINHSCDGGNLSTVLIRSSGALLPRVCFFASRDIQVGEELCFSYGDVRLRPEGLQCFCGSATCFGILPSEDT